MSIELEDATPETIEVGDKAVEQPKEPEAPKAKTYSEEEVQMLLQKETDRRVTPLGKQLAEIRRELEETKKSAMSEAERKRYEIEQEQKRYAEELESKSQALARYVTLAEIKGRGWDEGITEFLLSSDEAVVKERADKLQKLIEVEVAKVRSNTIKQSSVKPPVQSSSTAVDSNFDEFDMTDPQSLIRFAEAVKQGKVSLTQ